jgi:Cu-Zn family superoxide dismutase
MHNLMLPENKNEWKPRMKKIVLTLIAGAILAACQSSPMSSGKQARADFASKSGSNVTGYATFVERGDKVIVTTKVSGLQPNSQHGYHVHEKGDCSAPDATSAGGHFNPDNHPHGNPGQQVRHAGDMKNLVADAKGEATVTQELDIIRIDEGKFGILNRGLVIHANVDDYASQPAGNAGGRIACGLIRKS